MTGPSNATQEKQKSGSKQQSKKSTSNVRVVARIRPLSKREQNDKAILTALENKLVQVNSSDSSSKRWFELDAVLDASCSQKDLYEQSGAATAITDSLFGGFHCTILAYGQTGAGKTFSMGTAAATAVDESSGIIPRACEDLFRQIQEQCDGNAVVELSYLELYNEQMRDLMVEKGTSGAPLKIRQTLSGDIYVAGLTAVQVKSPAEIGQHMEAAGNRRVTAATQMNAVSSRSHAICTLRIKGVLEDGQQFQSKLTLVDLAGSERIKKTGAVGARQTEGININKSLLVLGQVVSALSSRNQRKPPYRDSQLTRLLQDSLGGNSRTLMIACVSPAAGNIDESVNTLRYATAARNITNTATKNMVETVTPEQAAALKRENELLKSQVAELTSMLQKMSAVSVVVGTSDVLENGEPTVVTTTTEEEEETTNAQPAPSNKLAAEHSESTNRTSATINVEDMQKQLHEANSQAITVPSLKVEITQLQEKVKASESLAAENESLQKQLDEAIQDADSARMAAAYLTDICERLKQIQRDELRSKQQSLQQIEKEQHWIAFVHMMLENYRMQVKDLGKDFEKKVVRAVQKMEAQKPAAAAPDANGESSDAQQQQNNPGRIKSAFSWISKQNSLPWRDATDFFKGRLKELEDSIQWEAESLKKIQGTLESDYSAARREIGEEESRCASLETDNTLVDQLTSMLLGGDAAAASSAARDTIDEEDQLEEGVVVVHPDGNGDEYVPRIGDKFAC